MEHFLLKKNNIFIIPSSEQNVSQGFPFLLGLKCILLNEDNKPTDKTKKIAVLITSQGLTNFNKYINSLSVTGVFKEEIILYNKEKDKHLIAKYPMQPGSYYYCFETSSLKKFEDLQEEKIKEVLSKPEFKSEELDF